MSVYLVKLTDTKTGQRSRYVPIWYKWNRRQRALFEGGPYSFDHGRAYLFALGIGVPHDIAQRIQDTNINRGKFDSGQYRVSIMDKGEIVYED